VSLAFIILMFHNLDTENTSEGETGNQTDELVIPADDMADQEIQGNPQVAELPQDGKKRITKNLANIIHISDLSITIMNYTISMDQLMALLCTLVKYYIFNSSHPLNNGYTLLH